MGNLAFLQPAFLAALAAVAIPILIHFIFRKKAIRWRFAAFEFLMRSHRRIARRLQIKQLLLLLLRCLLFILVALAFAKPFFQTAQSANPSMPMAIALIVDDSMSMRYQQNKTTRFEMARQRVLDFLRGLRGEDRVLLLRGSFSPHPQSLEQTELSVDKNIVIRKLEQWRVSYRTTDLAYTLRKAIHLLESAKGLKPKIVIFSDFARHAFDHTKLPKVSQAFPIELYPIRTETSENRAITHLEMQPAPFAGTDAYQLTATIRNFANQDVRNLKIKLNLNQRDRIQSFVSIRANSLTKKQFIIRLTEAGTYSGYLEIGPDPLPADNRLFFALRARQRPRVLLVNGDPRTIPYMDELFYLEQAMRDPRTPFAVDIVNASAKLPDPTPYQAIFLCNVGEIPQPWRENLFRYVHQGGGLFLSMGDQINPASFNEQFGSILPRHLRGVALAAQRPDGTGIALQRYFGEIKASHPIFQQLYQEGFVFESALVLRLMLVEPRRAQQEGEVLWRYSHGPPALLERRVGQGRVLLFTTTVDRDWANTAIRPFFLPWIHQVGIYLSGGARFQGAPPLLIDQSTRLLQIPGQGPIQALPPTGSPLWIRPATQGYLFPGGSVPGIYPLERNGKKLNVLPLIVNIDPRESDLTPLSLKQLAEIGTIASTGLTSVLQKQSERFWPMLLFLLLFVFFSEAVVMRFL